MKITKKFLIREYIKNKKTTYQIADMIKVSQRTIMRNMVKYKIPRRNWGQHLKIKNYPKKDWLFREYIVNKKTQKEIANILHCNRVTVRNYLLKYKIKLKDNKNSEKSQNRCMDCGKKIRNCKAKRCQSCSRRGKLNPSYKGKIKKVCDNCDKELWVFPSKRNNSYYFCSKKCYYSFRSLYFRGEKSPGYIDGRKTLTESLRNCVWYKDWRTQVFERDNYTCQSCGKRGTYLEAHHIQPFAKLLQEFLKEYDQFSPIEDKETLARLAIKWKPFWNIGNGQTLCKNCHNKTKRGSNDKILKRNSLGKS